MAIQIEVVGLEAMTQKFRRVSRMAARSLRKTRVSKPLPQRTKRAAGRLKFVENVAAPLAARAAVFVAVIVRQGFANSDSLWRFASGRSDDGWYALIGGDKDKLVTEALAKARSFGSSQKYEVVVGTLGEMVVVPTFFNYETL